MSDDEENDRRPADPAQRRGYLIVFTLLGIVALALIVAGTAAIIDGLAN